MGQNKGLWLLAGAALALTGGVANAQQSSDEVRAVVAEMMSDAETRSSLLAGGDAGHDGKFFIQGDGFRLNIGGQLQFRHVFNFRDKDRTNDEFKHGFTNRRIKLDFDGQLNKDWFYRVRLTNSSSDSVGFDYAYAGYKFGNGGKLTWGQYKIGFTREELVSDGRQLAVERSLANSLFTAGYSQGIEYAYETEQWRLFASVSDGLNSQGTEWNTRENTGGPFVRGQAEYALTARGEFLLAGNWKQFNEFTSPKGSDFGAMFGAAAHWQQSDNSQRGADIDRDSLFYTADISVKGDSWNAFGAFLGRYIKDRQFGSNTKYNDFGAVIQGGWRFAENTEVFARWDALFLDKDWVGGGKKNYHFITAGLNQYYAGHAAKASVDVVWALQRASALSSFALPDSGVGLLGQDKSGEIAVRLQFQLLF